MKFIASLLCLIGCLATTSADAASLLRVESASGGASVQRGSSRITLQNGSELLDQDTVTVAAGGKLSLRFGRHGIFELGPGAELSVERLPFSSWADDLRSVFRLKRGYLRVIWKHPSISANWPLFVFLGDQRASLVNGEFFFERGTRDIACSAEGQFALTAGRGDTRSLDAETCYTLAEGQAPKTVPREPRDWVVMRQSWKSGLDNAPAATAVAAAPPPVLQPAPAVPSPAPKPEPAKPEPSRPTVAARPEPRPPAEIAARAPAPAVLPPTTEIVVPPPSRSVVAAAQTAPAPRPTPAPSRAMASTPAAPAAAPAQVPATAPPAAAGTGAWALNLASFPDQDTAQTQVQKLRNAGYPAAVEPALVKGKTWYRVQIKGLSSVDEAKRMGDDIRQKLGLGPAWVFRP